MNTYVLSPPNICLLGTQLFGIRFWVPVWLSEKDSGLASGWHTLATGVLFFFHCLQNITPGMSCRWNKPLAEGFSLRTGQCAQPEACHELRLSPMQLHCQSLCVQGSCSGFLQLCTGSHCEVPSKALQRYITCHCYFSSTASSFLFRKLQSYDTV